MKSTETFINAMTFGFQKAQLQKELYLLLLLEEASQYPRKK